MDKEKISAYLIENLEIVNVKDGGGESTAIAIKNTTEDSAQDRVSLEFIAMVMTREIMKLSD